jgi:hypothetical protein
MAAVSQPVGRMRRYPALMFLALAAVLATLLPSALRVPLTGPSATAEIAPVPGKSKDPTGNLSSLDATSTQGLGFGLGSGGVGGGGGGGAGSPPLPQSQGSNPVQKRCVGKPPYTRQTEDPLSPPCVAYFKGDNFGSTWTGVTRDEVDVIAWAACGTDGSVALKDLSVPDENGYHWAEFLHYFNDRFQTYGRTVRLWVTVPPNGQKMASTCGDNSATTRAAVQNAIDLGHPFFITSWFGTDLPQGVSEVAAHRRVMSQAGTPPRDFTAAHSPYVISWEPDVTNLADHVVGLVCSSLAGRPVTFGDPSDKGKRRKFAVVYNEWSDASNAGLDLVRNGIHDRCGDQAGTLEATPAGRQPSPADMDRLHSQGVTTVLWLDSGPPLALNGTGSTSSVGTNSWHPEFILTDSEFVGRNDLSRDFGSSLTTSAGLMLDRRRGAYGDQPEKIALRDACPDCAPSSIDIGIYDRLFMLFTGIQAAGPRLTPQSFDNGMRALPPHSQGDPYVPAAYFGPGDHAFIKDEALVWWDSSGTAPSGTEPGCWRLVEDGRRYRTEDWAGRQGADTGIFQRLPAQPCQGEQ